MNNSKKYQAYQEFIASVEKQFHDLKVGENCTINVPLEWQTDWDIVEEIQMNLRGDLLYNLCDNDEHPGKIICMLAFGSEYEPEDPDSNKDLRIMASKIPA